MAQAFITTYNYYYRTHEFDLRQPFSPTDKFFSKVPEGDMWIKKKPLRELGDLDSDNDELKEIHERIHKMVMDRYWSIYKLDYCKGKETQKQKERAKEEQHVEGEVEPEVNELLEHCRKLYAPRTQKILPPLPTSRRVFGYLKPARMYTGETTYQVDIGKGGYQILEENNKKSKGVSPLKEFCQEVKLTGKR